MERDRKYWEHEEPTVVEAEHLVVRYYPKAEKIQFSYPDFSPAWALPNRAKLL